MSYKQGIMDAWLAEQCAYNAQDGYTLVQAVQREQVRRLQKVLGYAKKHSSFYAKHFAHIQPESMDLAQFATLPFITSQDIQDAQGFYAFLCVSLDAVERVVSLHTSGTTALPKRLAFTMEDLAATKDFFRVGMRQLVSAGERVLVLWPDAQRPHGVGALLREALQAQGVQVFVGNPVSTEDSLRCELYMHNPHVLVAAPQQWRVLDTLLCTEHKYALRGILSSAENIDSALVQKFATQHSITVLDHYGMTEMGYGGGVECFAHDGYHLRELDIFVEIVDIDSGQALAHNTEGEIVITTLRCGAMPLIRYRTGDVAALLPAPCACGSPLRRLSPIRGRLHRKEGTCRIEHIVKGSFYERNIDAYL